MLFEEFELTEDQRAMRATARRFAKEHIKPIASQIDRIADPKDSFPWDMFKTASSLGLRTLALPESYGGINADLVTKIIVAQELGYGDVICAKIISQCWKTSRLLYDAGTQEQRKHFLPEYRDDETYIISQALTEPDAGSDNLLPYNEPGAGMQLSARKEKGGYVLNGTKHFIANGNVAKLFIVAARTDPGAPVKQGTSFFLVPKDTPGFSVWSVQDKVGFRAYGQAELVLEDVFVPEENLLGGKENVDTVSQAVTPYSKLDIATHSLTLMESAYNSAFEYAQTRVQGGKPIIEHQVIAAMLADMYISIQAAQGMIRQMVRLTEKRDWDPKLAIASKVFASEAAVKLAISAMEVFGGYGVMKEMPMEKHVRDSLIFLHIDGTNQINRQKICNLLKPQKN